MLTALGLCRSEPIFLDLASGSCLKEMQIIFHHSQYFVKTVQSVI